MEVGLGPGHIVLDGDPATLRKKGQSPTIFGPFLLWPNGWMHQDATWYGGRPQPRRLCVRWGPSCPSQKGGAAPNFRFMSIVAKRLDGSKMPLGMEVGLGPGDIVLDGYQAPPKRGHSPIFSQCPFWPNCSMD